MGQFLAMGLTHKIIMPLDDMGNLNISDFWKKTFVRLSALILQILCCIPDMEKS